MLTKNEELLCHIAKLNDTGDYCKVTELLTDELLKQHNSAALYTERARSWYNLGEYDKQLNDCRAAVKIDDGYHLAYVYFGNYLLQKYDHKKAIANYTKAIKLNGKCDQAYNNRGTAYLRLGEFNLAEEDFITALAINPSCGDTHNNLGCLWYNNFEFDKAIGSFTKAIACKSSDAGFYYNRALAWLYKQEFEKALEDLDFAVRYNPAHSHAYFERGLLWLKLNDYKKAFADFTSAVKADADFKHGLAYFERGNIWLAEREYEKAIEDYNEALRINQHFAEAYKNRGEALHALLKYDEANADFAKAIGINSKDAGAYYKRGMVWIDKGDYNNAIADFNEALRLGRYSADAYYRRGVLWFSRREFDKAIEDFNKCLAIDASLHTGLNYRARTWLAKKEYEKALDDCNAALAIMPAFAEAFYTRGIIYINVKEFNKAFDDFDQALKHNPALPLAYNNRGLLLYARGEYKKALDDFTKCTELMPGDARSYCNAGIIWHNLKNYNAAVEYYNKAVKLDEKYADAYCKRGNAFFAKKKYEEALADFEKAVALDKDFAFLGYNIDIAKAQTGRHVDAVDDTGANIFYFAEKLLQNLPLSDRTTIRKILSSITEASSAIKEYAATDVATTSALYYYTNLKVADVLVMNKNARLPYFNAIAQLQSEENVLLDFLSSGDVTGIKSSFDSSGELGEHNIYVGCFAPAAYKTRINGYTRVTADQNTSGWKLHPRNNAGDVAECGLVITTGFFAQNDDHIFLDDENFCLQSKTKMSEKPREQLHKVLYYNTISGEIAGDENGYIKKCLQELKQGLQQLMLYSNSAGPDVDYIVSRLVYRVIAELRYLFKDARYAAENELRIVEYITADDARVKTGRSDDLPRSLYIESSRPLHPHLFEVVLGPTVSNPERWTYLGIHMKRNRYANI